MADPVIPALVKRRGDLLAELIAAQANVQRLHDDLASLDAVIRQYDPDYPVGNIRPRYRRPATAAEHGAMSRAVQDTLRRATEPLAVPEIAARIMAERGLNAADRATARNMVKRVGMALRYQRTNGITREAEGLGAVVLSEVAR